MKICKKILWPIGTALFLAALPLTAQAVPATGPYLAFGVGYNFAGSGENRAVTPAGTARNLWQKNYDNALFTASSGYAFSTGWRLEAEGNYTRSPFSLGQDLSKRHGFLQQYGVMLNGYYDFDVGLSWFYPYFGAGFGYQWLSQSERGYKSLNNPGTLAYQLIAGATLPLPPVVGLSLIMNYRFMDMIGPGVKFYYPASGGIRQVSLAPMSNMALTVGLKYNFGASAEAPTAQPLSEPGAFSS